MPYHPYYKAVGYTDLVSKKDGHSIRDQLPSFAKVMLGKFSPLHGPNCWNASCLYFNPRLGLRGLSDSEMISRLSEDFEGVTHLEDLKRNDLIALWGSMGGREELYHTMIFLDGEFIFHKASSQISTPYVIESLWRHLQSDPNYQSLSKVTFHRAKPGFLIHQKSEFELDQQDGILKLDRFMRKNPDRLPF